jgi:hypothetical protein
MGKPIRRPAGDRGEPLGVDIAPFRAGDRRADGVPDLAGLQSVQRSEAGQVRGDGFVPGRSCRDRQPRQPRNH